MQTVHKYKLSNGTETEIYLPIGAEPLEVTTQKGDVFLWAKVDTEQEKEKVIIEIFGTGQPMPDFQRRYIDTFLTHGGDFVFHAFLRIN